MDTQAPPTMKNELTSAQWFSLSRSFDERLQWPTLSLELRFPWALSRADEIPATICPELIQIQAVTEGESPVVVFDDFEGVSLTEAFEQEPTSPERAFTILRKVATALDHLHACNRTHGGLKPSSILVGEGLSVRIVDWMVDWNRVPLTYLSDAAEYLSPERLASNQMDPRADQFALAVIAYQLLLERDPFPGSGLAEKLFRIRYGLPDQNDFGETNFAVHTVYDRAFSTDPTDRFESCLTMIEELEKAPRRRIYTETRLLDVEAEEVDSHGALEDNAEEEIPTGKSARTNLSSWWVVASILAFLAFGLGVLNWRTQNRIQDVAEQAERVANSSAATTLENGSFQVCNVSPDTLDIRELAVAYFNRDRKLTVFSSAAVNQAGWVVPPASSLPLAWPQGGKSAWDGSVLFYSAKVQHGQRELWVSGRWDGSANGCLHLSM